MADGRDPEMVDDAMEFLLDPNHPLVDEGAPYAPDTGGEATDEVEMFCDCDQIQVVRVNHRTFPTPFGTTVTLTRVARDIYREAAAPYLEDKDGD